MKAFFRVFNQNHFFRVVSVIFVFSIFLLLFGIGTFVGSVSAVTFTVDSLNDGVDAIPGDGICATGASVCTLRAAVREHNVLGGINTINFSVTGVINVGSVIVIGSDNLTIDGGTSHNVVLNGGGTSAHDGIIVDAADNTIKGLVVQNFAKGISIKNIGSTGNKVQNNYLGTDASGTSAVANDIAIYVYTASSNIIGTDGDGIGDSGEGNLLSGNVSNGVYLEVASLNTFAGNKVGVNLAGTGVLANGAIGVRLNNADSNIIGTDGDGTSDVLERNIVSGNGNYGMYIINGSSSNIIAGNYVGTNEAGNSIIANTNDGIHFGAASNSNRVGTDGDGTSDTEERNVISGSTGDGIEVNGSDSNIIAGNYIGLNAAGTGLLENNGAGIFIDSSEYTTIGTDSDGIADVDERNVIAGGNSYSIYISDADALYNTVKGNYIGTAANGITDFGSHKHGIRIDDGSQSNTIGGAVTNDGNLIFYNGDATGEYGISIEDSTTKYNKISRNSIYSNHAGGISLLGGANDSIVQPVISSAVDGGSSSSLTLAGTCLTDSGGATVELFESFGDGQGRIYLNSVTTTNGNWSMGVTGFSTTVGRTLVVTVTDSTSSTSIFSAEYTVPDIAAVASTSGTVNMVNERATMFLVGTSSYDANHGDIVTYFWTLVGGGGMIGVPTLATAEYTAPEVLGGNGSATVRLTVGGGDTSDLVIIIVNIDDLAVDIVDASGVGVGSPSVSMGSIGFLFIDQVTTGVLGVSSEKIRITNTTSTATWSLSAAASGGSTDLWDGAVVDYDFNDSTANACDGADADSLGGQLTVDPSVGTITPEGGCSSTDISLGSSASFSEGVVDSITLLTAGSSADTGCYWDVTGVSLSQTIPAEQNADSYTIDITLTLVAI